LGILIGNVVGSVSAMLIIFLSDAVTSAPTNLTALVVSPTSIWVTWGVPTWGVPTWGGTHRPVSGSSPGLVTHYKLFYYSTADPAGEADVNVIDTEYALVGLLKFHEYNIRVVAYNKNGPTASSSDVSVRTYSDGKNLL